ncbi:hypothetical protein [Flagellimonas sp. SN16]|uniref:hypothetical protein n=1 Tax=Flagellimonas sp. SN16 TaxID=3415142 RepID=UPI003C4E95CC
MNSKNEIDKKEVLDKLRDNGLLKDSVRDELYDLIVDNDKKELEKAKNRFNKSFEDLKRMGMVSKLGPI